MLGYVKEELLNAEREKVETEREARIKAEALAVQLSKRIADLQLSIAHYRQMYQDSVTSRRFEMESHERQMKELLEHVAPLASPSSVNPNIPPLKASTAEEIMREPASTRREMILRAQRAAAARQREVEEKEGAAHQRRQELLTDDEKRATMPDFDYTLGVYKEPPQSVPTVDNTEGDAAAS